MTTLLAKLTSELKNNLGISGTLVGEVGPRIWKRGADFALRLPEMPALIPQPDSRFTELHISGMYLNVRVNPEAMLPYLNEIKQPPKTGINQPVAVEHTSLTPAYPLNLTTLRSSLLGDVLIRAFANQGRDVSGRYFLEDKCWHTGVIGEKHQRWIHLKPDHAVGRAFAQAVFTRRSNTAREALADAVKLFPEIAIRSFGETERFPDSVTACLTGVRETLSTLGALPQEIDRESNILTSHERERLTSIAEDAKTPPGVLRPYSNYSYVVRSALYFATLLESFPLIVPVVSIRQNVQVRSAAYWAECLQGDQHGVIVPVYFADVLKDGKPDSISFRRFHSVDSVLEELRRELRLSKSSASDVLRLMMLSHPSNRPIRYTAPISAHALSILGRITLQQLRGAPCGIRNPVAWPPGAIFMLEDALAAPRIVSETLDPRVAATSFLRLLFLISRARVPEALTRVTADGFNNLCQVLGLQSIRSFEDV